MKKLALATLALTCAASVFAQGTVTLNNRVVGAVVTHIYAPFAPGSSVHQIGNNSADTPTGTTDWTGYQFLSGAGFFAQLLAAPGNNQPEASLLPAVPTTTFRTGTAAGFIAGVTATVGNVPGDTTPATLQLVVWDNSSGLYSTWTQARQAWVNGLIAAGVSPTINLSQLGGTSTPPNLVGLQSFNIYFVPEPSTFALAGLGAASLLIFRRRK
jgi:hypothetical protein